MDWSLKSRIRLDSGYYCMQIDHFTTNVYGLIAYAKPGRVVLRADVYLELEPTSA